MSSSLSNDEQFVIESLSSKLGGTWRPGENPPDAYLMQGNIEVAIEISTLTQHVTGKSGALEPRLSQDMGVLRLCNELNEELDNLIQPNKYIILTLHTPVDKLRKFKKILKDRLIEIANSGATEDVSSDIKGNIIKVHIVKDLGPSKKKVVCVVVNRNSNPDITLNVNFILSHRVQDKTHKCSNVTHRPLWLALFNDYWLADSNSFEQAMQQYSKVHPFEKIFLISGNREVHLIHET